MNYLAHLHIADHCQSSLLGNLLGDFVKGSPEAQFEPNLSQGIRLHRFVDSFTDQHQGVSMAKALFPNGVRRFSGIGLDMFWDHCLAKHWGKYHPESLVSFCAEAEVIVSRDSPQSLPSHFVRTAHAMWQGKWLQSYQDLDNIGLALQRMSMRSPKMARLADCFPFLEQHYLTLNEVFSEFYPEILTASKRF
ncbi:ACP phosphodiesterase [Vibrio ostreicida]|uniref:ACP phosphodiesterase n=1 Tax=Vibrio ostreicida TaxID=526588 RepID=A0ABT8BYE4_9VIBR|nr:ACP phosphodiesterase [Vibrio ostreicida]MDN3611709.1 ACP phosphodiesterase [Vibrio ostreicida]NPD10096.1 DUF479 domain-containing protein [Vibrio ostreicida]